MIKPAAWYPTAFSLWGDEERAAIERVVASGRFTMGDEVAAFEREFSSWHLMRHGIMVNSGSSANLVMISALAHLGLIKREDRVLVPAIAWSTTYAPLVQHGLNLVLADVDHSWNADLQSKSIDLDSIRLVLACSILGNPAPLREWVTAAGILEAEMVEDNCESLGASIDGQLCGTVGLMNTFSFFHSHQISAIEGGMILTNDDECARVCRMLRAHGWSRDIEAPLSFEQEYDFRAFGYNVRPLEMHAAIAREQLKRLPRFIEERQANLGLFRRITADLPIEHPEVRGVPSPFGLHFLVKDAEARGRLVVALRAAGIDCRLPTGGSFTKHAYGARWRDQPTPRADDIHDRGLFLGNGPLNLSTMIARAAHIMKEVL